MALHGPNPCLPFQFWTPVQTCPLTYKARREAAAAAALGVVEAGGKVGGVAPWSPSLTCAAPTDTRQLLSSGYSLRPGPRFSHTGATRQRETAAGSPEPPASVATPLPVRVRASQCGCLGGSQALEDNLFPRLCQPRTRTVPHGELWGTQPQG